MRPVSVLSMFTNITCSSSLSDAAVKQILLSMNEKSNFIIEDLDDFHLVIKANEEWRVRNELENEVRMVFHVTSLRN